MKKLRTKILFFSILLCGSALGQPVFEDDFESYMVGDYLAANSPYWYTWSNNPGSDEDGVISDNFSYSGLQSLHVYGEPSGGPMGCVSSIRFGDSS